MSSTIRVETITLGDELLLGIRENAHLTYLGVQLAHHGLEPAANLVIRDNPEDIKNFSFRVLEKIRLVITTGGLGPTTDDLTRESIAQALDEELVYDSFIEKAIRDRFQQLEREMPQNNLRQCYRPKNAEVIPNPYGTAPDSFLKKEGKILVMFRTLPARCIPCFRTGSSPCSRRPVYFLKLTATCSCVLRESESLPLPKKLNPSFRTSRPSRWMLLPMRYLVDPRLSSLIPIFWMKNDSMRLETSAARRLGKILSYLAILPWPR